MLTKSEAIVLRVIPYADNKLILNCYSPGQGKIAFVDYRSKGRKKQRSGYFHPLAIVEVEYNSHERKQVYAVKSIQHSSQFQSLLTNPLKQSFSLFLSEFLNLVLKDEDANEELYTYIKRFIGFLNEAKGSFDLFHLKFILGLAAFTGFFPEIQFKAFHEKSYLNLMSGCFEEADTSLTISANCTWLLVRLSNTSFDSLHDLQVPPGLITEGLNALMQYYSIHFPDFKIPSSLKIFRGY